MKKILSALFVFNIFIYVVPALLPSVYAFTMRSAQEVVIPKDQTISGTFVAQGQTIRIDGPIQGDLICAGQTVEITSTIEGDVICAGQSIAIRGSVNGNIRAAAQTLTVSGRIARNITALGQTITEDAPIGGELLVGGQTMTMNGSTKGDTAGAVQNAVINGQIGHNLILTVGNLTVSNGAKIAGTVDYTSARNAMIAGGTVSGKVIRHQPKQEQHQQTVNWGAIWFGEFLASLIFNLVIALIFVALWPFAMQRVTNNMKMSIWRSIGIGILVFILTPILAFFMLVTIIGIPLAILLFILYALVIFMSRIFVGIAVGRVLTRKYWKAKERSLLWSTAVGIVVTWIIYAIPVIGWILSFIAILWGLGGVYYLIRPHIIAPEETIVSNRRR